VVYSIHIYIYISADDANELSYYMKINEFDNIGVYIKTLGDGSLDLILIEKTPKSIYKSQVYIPTNTLASLASRIQLEIYCNFKSNNKIVILYMIALYLIL
jgi:hypothetical protein